MRPHAIDLNLTLPFEPAGVEFDIRVGSSGDETTFTLCALDDSGNHIPFASESSPVLADWVRGYTRWLYRAGVSARYSETAITGSFAHGMSAERILEGLQLACDMIRQRFELYEDSIRV